MNFKTKGVLALKMRLNFTSIIGSILLILAIAAGIGYYYANQYAQIGVGMMAKQMCSCLYVQNRDEDECKADMNKSMGEISKKMKITYLVKNQSGRFTGKDGGSEVGTANFPDGIIVGFYGIAIAKAKISPGYGCSVTKFDGIMPNGLNNINQ